MSETVQLADVAQINPKGPARGEMHADEVCDFVPMAGVHEDGTMEVVEQRPYHKVAKGYTPFRSGDVLLAKITPCFENGKISLARTSTEYAFGSTEFHVIRPMNGDLDSRYLYYFLRQGQIRTEGENQMTGSAGQKRVPRRFLDQLKIPLPDIEEQRRIAAILDNADGIRRKREQALALVDKLLRAAFLDTFGDPILNTKGLPTIALGDLIKVSSGNGLTAKNMDPSGSYPVYGGNGINGYHSEYMFEEPQIVVGRVGVYCGAVHVSEPKAWITDNALYVREYKKPVNKTYLAWALRFANLNQYAGRAAQPLISGSRIYPIEIVLPSNGAQEEFSGFVDRHRALLENMSAARSESDELFKSIAQRAFRGEL